MRTPTWTPTLDERAYEKSLSESVERRERYYTYRFWVRASLLPAVLGIGCLIYFCTRETPIEEWWWGFIGVLLIVPLLSLLSEGSN